MGTKSARVAFEDCSFLEIIGPDPKQPHMVLGEKLAQIPAGQMVPMHYAIRSERGEQTNWSDINLECDKVTMIAKDRGLLWKWDMHLLEGHNQGGVMPYLVNWGEAHHAAGRLPIVGTLDKVKVQAPRDSQVHELLLGISGVFVDEGDDLLEFSITSPKGTHKFSSEHPIGIEFPK